MRALSGPKNPDQPLNGGAQMVEVSRDGRRVYVTNSLYSPWDAQFYPDGIRGWMAKVDVNPLGGIAFDERFRARGDSRVFEQLFDEAARDRAVTTLDGWLAYWQRESLRYRVYPGRGSPLDHPMPLSDLALGRSATRAERLVAVIELLIELARRGVDVPAVPAEPEELKA